jgi:hypothetical protein
LLAEYNADLSPSHQITIDKIPQPKDWGFINVPKLAMEIFNFRTKQGEYAQ